MADTILKTRIQLKYGSYADWMASTGIALEGEVLIANAPAESNSGLTEPAVLIKVGDGVNTYANLPFVTALAGDVLTACKTTEGLTKFVEDVLVSAGVLSGEDEGQEKSLAERITGAEDAIEALQTLVGSESVSKQISDATAETLQSAKDYADEKISAQIASTYKAAGTVANVAALPAASKATLGYVYNITSEGTTTADFVEGAGKDIPAGSNIVVVEIPATEEGGESTYAYDVLAGIVDLSDYDTADEVDAKIKTLEDSIPQAVADAMKPVEPDPENPDEPVVQNPVYEAVEKLVGEAVDELNVTDTAETGKFVTAVSQTKGVISVIRAALEATDIPTLTSDKISDITTKIETVVTSALTAPAEGETSAIYDTLTEKIETIVKESLGGDNANTDLEDTIKNLIDEALKDAGTPADGENPAVPGSTLNETVNSMIDSKIEALDKEDTAVDGQVVTAVSQEDGLITVVRRALVNADLPDAIPTSKIDGLAQFIATTIINNTTAPEEGATNNNYDALAENISKIVVAELSKTNTDENPNEFYNHVATIVDQMIDESLKEGDNVVGEAVEAIITDRLEALTLTDTVEDKKVIQTVIQTDGKVATTKTTLADIAFSGKFSDLVQEDGDDTVVLNCGGTI